MFLLNFDFFLLYNHVLDIIFFVIYSLMFSWREVFKLFFILNIKTVVNFDKIIFF